LAAKFFMNGGVNSNWSDDTNWSTTASTGPNNTTHAVAGDTVTINAGSPACVINVASACTSINCTGYTNTLTFTGTLTTAGNVTLATGMTLAGTADLILTANTLITSAGKTFTGGVQFGGADGTAYTFSGAMVITGAMTVNASGGTGAFITNGTISVAGGLVCTGNSSFVATRSTVTLTGGTWSGAGAFRNNLTIAGNVTISGSVAYAQSTLLYSSGTVTTTGSTLTIGNGAMTLNLGAVALNNLTLAVTTGTLTLGSNLTVSGLLSITSETVFGGAFTITCGNCTLAVNAVTLSGALIVSGTLTLPNSALTWTGAFNITCGTLTNTSYSATRIVTWVSGTTVTINTAFTTVGGSATNRFSWKASTPGSTVAWHLAFGATQSINHVDPTDLDAFRWQPVVTPDGVITNSRNWVNAVATSPSGGTTPSATDPAAGDSLCGATNPLLYCILQTNSGSATYSWVDQPMNEAAVQRQPRIVNVSKLRREMSDWSRRMVINDGSVTLTDYDGAIRALIVANTIVRKQIDFYMIDEANWRIGGTPYRVNQSLITDYTVNADMTVTLSFEDRFGGDSLRDLLNRPLPFRTIDTTFNATLPTQMGGKGEPIPYGLLSDEAMGFPTVQVWYTGTRLMPDSTTWYEGLIAGCATSGPLSVWGADGVTVDANGDPLQVKLDPALYDTDIAMPGLGTVWSGFYGSTIYSVVNSRRYMLMYFKVGSVAGEAFKLFSTSNGSQGVPVHINMGGVEQTGDSTGSVIDSLPRQWQHLLTNFVEQNHVTDANWYAIPSTANASPYSIINATSVETAKTRSEVRRGGGYLGAFVVGHDLNRTTLGDWLQRICLGGDMDMFVDRHGRACLSMEDPTLTPVKAFTITNTMAGTYRTWKDRSKLANDITCFTFKNLTQTNASVTLRPSSPQQPTEWLTGKRDGVATDGTSITALGGDPVGRRTFHYEDWVTRDVLLTTTGSVQAHCLERSKNGPDFHQLETDLCGLDVELGNIFSVTHFSGLVATTRKVRCTAIELEVPDPFTKKWAVRLFGYDVTDLVS